MSDDELAAVGAPPGVAFRALARQPIVATTAGLFRVAAPGGSSAGWSAVLKIVQPTGPPPPAGAGGERVRPSNDPADPHWWRREVEAYRSGELPVGGGLAAPRCLAAVEAPDGRVHLWLEDVRGVAGRRWSLRRLGRAAYELGVWQGAPRQATVAEASGWVGHGHLAAMVPASPPKALDPAAFDSPLLAGRVDPVGLAATTVRLVDGAPALVAALDRLPTTLCHHDVWPPNLIARAEQTVLLDWALAGAGPPGVDLATLVLDSVWMGFVDPGRAAEVEQVVLTGYLDGLSAARSPARGDDVRFAYAAASALIFGLTEPAGLATLAADEARHAEIERHHALPIDRVVAARAAMVTRTLALADEALDRVG